MTQGQCHHFFAHNKMAMSSSQDKASQITSQSAYQPGGTLTLAIGKWANQVTNWGQDAQHGRWSYLELLGQHGKWIIIASAYWVCPQTFDTTSNTVTAQQSCLLLQQGKTDPNPCKQFIEDFVAQIKQWWQQDKEVLIGMDANEDVDDSKSKIMWLFTETDLIDLHHHRYPAQTKPATHQCGSKTIDVMAGSNLLAMALSQAWILPFAEPPLIKGDHKLVGLDFDPLILFGGMPATPTVRIMRGINSRHKLNVTKFCKQAVHQCHQHQLAKQIDLLMVKPNLKEHDHAKLEAIDAMLTKILVNADKECRPTNPVPWSLTLQQAYILHCYWSLHQTMLQTKRDLAPAIKCLSNQLDPSSIQEDESTSLSTHLR